MPPVYWSAARRPATLRFRASTFGYLPLGVLEHVERVIRHAEILEAPLVLELFAAHGVALRRQDPLDAPVDVVGDV